MPTTGHGSGTAIRTSHFRVRNFDDNKAMQRGAAVFLGTILTVSLALLQMDLGYFTQRSTHPAARTIALPFTIVAALALWRTATASTARTSALAALFGGTFAVLSAVRMAALRTDSPSMAVAVVVIALGASVILPWGPWWQAVLAATLLGIVAIGVHWLGVTMSVLLAVFLAVLTIVSVYLAHLSERSRRELLLLQDELSQALHEAEERHRTLGSTIRAQTRDLEEAASELAEFCHAASHDIRPPLRTIAGYSDILSEEFAGNADRDAREAVEGIVPLATEMGLRIDRLLDGVRAMHRSMAGTLLSLGDILREESGKARAAGVHLREDSATGLYADTLGTVAGDLLRAMVRYAASLPTDGAVRNIRLIPTPPEHRTAGYALRIDGVVPRSEEVSLLSRCLSGDLGRGSVPVRLDDLSTAARAWRAEHDNTPAVASTGDALEFSFGCAAPETGQAEAPA